MPPLHIYLKKFVLDFLFPRPKEPITITSSEFIEKAKKDKDFKGKDTLAVFSYKEPMVKKLVWQLKYMGNEEAARLMAEVLHQEILAIMEDWLSFEDFKDPILIPVPLSKKKLVARGYNQTEMIIKEMEILDESKNFQALYDVLRKKKETKDQTSLKTKKERLSNLKDSFSLSNKREIKDRNVIIIDDVVTTGATINEIKRTLKKGGVRKVKAVTIAH
jgi:competence protein ComFC